MLVIDIAVLGWAFGLELGLDTTCHLVTTLAILVDETYGKEHQYSFHEVSDSGGFYTWFVPSLFLGQIIEQDLQAAVVVAH